MSYLNCMKSLKKHLLLWASIYDTAGNYRLYWKHVCVFTDKLHATYYKYIAPHYQKQTQKNDEYGGNYNSKVPKHEERFAVVGEAVSCDSLVI